MAMADEYVYKISSRYLALYPDFFVLTFFAWWAEMTLTYRLYYGHKAQEMILTNVRDTLHADSLALFELNIYILLADVTKPEKSTIPTLTWPVTSLVTPKSFKFVFPRRFSRAFKCRFNFQSRSSSFGDQRGLEIAPPQ